MWFKLSAADFSANNLGTMSSISKSYKISTDDLIGLSVTPTSISFETEGESKTQILTFTVRPGYKFTSGSTIKLNGSTIYTAPSDIAAGGTFTASITISANASVSGTATVVSGGNTGGSEGDEPETPVNPPSSESNYTLIHGNKYASGHETNTARASISPLTIVVPTGVTITNKSTIKWAYYTGVNTNNMPSGTGSGTWDDYKYTGTGAAIGISFKKADDSAFDWSIDSTNPADYFDVSDEGLWNGTAGGTTPEPEEPDTPEGSVDINAFNSITLVNGNPFGTSAQQTAANRVHGEVALYAPAGTVITCKDTTTYKWALRRVKSETNLADGGDATYKPDSVWTTKTSYTTEVNGYWCFILLKASDVNFDWSVDSNKVSDYFTVS